MAEGSGPQVLPFDQGFNIPAVPIPTVGRIRKVADKLGLDLSDQELEEITGCMGAMLGPYNRVYRMSEPKPPVKYPRTPGYRPPPEENKLNAWYMKTDIQGAPAGKLLDRKVAVKDSICVAGVPMMNGSKLMEGYVPEFDATVVSRILDAGGHIAGKSACEHFCLSGTSLTNDIAPVLNPHDLTRTSGGSSSGSAALVASGEVDLAVGGDQAGSIRIPAAWCGIVGLKPTFGLVPYTGAASLEPTHDHLGPMARTVKDCALLLEVLAGVDGMDDRQPDKIDVPAYSKELKSDLSGVKIGLVEEGFHMCAPDVVSTVRAAANLLSDTGATVNSISIPMHTDGHAIWTPISMEGAYTTLLDKAGAGPSGRGFHPTSMKDHQTRAVRLMPNGLSTPMKLVGLFGQYLKEENNHHFYSRATNLVMSLTAAYDRAFEEVDVLVMPTLPCTATKIPTENESIFKTVGKTFSMINNTSPFNATGHPALTINAGQSEGLPVGMMVIGRRWYDQTVLNVAYAFEGLRDKEQ